MGQLTPVQLEDGTLIYIEAAEDAKLGSAVVVPDQSSGSTDPKRSIFPKEPSKQITQSFQEIERTVRVHTTHMLDAFRNLAIAEVREVTLKFGVNVDVQTGLPYIANGKAGCSTEITVKCVFPEQKQE